MIADNKYVRDGITQRIKVWKLNKWKTTKRGDVLNNDLWLMLDDLQENLSKLEMGRGTRGHRMQYKGG